MDEIVYKLRYSNVAQDYVKQIKESAFDKDGKRKTGNRHLAVYDGLKNLFEDIIPYRALDPTFTLETKHGISLGGVNRAKQGRLRIYWIASSAKRLVYILFIGYRKEGDRKDAYRKFVAHLRRGSFDRLFANLDQKNPLTR